jgi:predicted nucleic acid-binding protein
VLLDSGPLAAIVAQGDAEHATCSLALSNIEPPLLTCWPVLTEVAWLLRRDQAAIRTMLRGADTGFFTLLPLADDDLRQIDGLFVRYKDLRPQIADLALLHLAQRESLDTVFTIDRRDFTVFRVQGRKPLRLLPEA